jgi:phenylalanyl-tRNA synthetase alpha chain
MMDQLRKQLLADLEQARTQKDIEEIRVRYIGRKGLIGRLGKETDFTNMSPDEKRKFGKSFNELMEFAQVSIDEAMNARANERPEHLLDLTLPGKGGRVGTLHPITLVQLELEEIFAGLGFMTLPGYEVETEYYNFDSLNIPFDHPARDMQDTYWLENGLVLRTHTSASQVRAIERFGAPLRAIFPGRCFRYETVDATHDNTFFQLEGLMVDRDISTAKLIGVMKLILEQVFKREVTVRLRPGYFPFVEPGFELDLQCLLCGGAGCRTCGNGWIELIPCGLVHPKVLKHGGVDPDLYSGFAFGLGLTRLAMMKFGIPNIRLFNSGDIRFYGQFPGTV